MTQTMTGARYLVKGRLAFRGHAPGTIFEAVLDPVHEQRALLRGNIEVIDRFTPRVQPGSYELPVGWVNPR